VPPGVLSASVLLTNLANRMQPLIRYQLDDRVRVLERPCACGSPFTAIEVQGRSGDTLHLPALDGAAVANSRRAGVPIVPLALETAIEEGAGLTQFQIIERERGGRPALEVRFEAAVAEPRQAFRRCSDAIGRYLATQGVKKTPCRYCAEPPLREPASGKLRRVLRARA
jgi:phenylacetate-coenzyme A ligase PaaK-like adenylate-forming protein